MSVLSCASKEGRWRSTGTCFAAPTIPTISEARPATTCSRELISIIPERFLATHFIAAPSLWFGPNIRSNNGRHRGRAPDQRLEQSQKGGADPGRLDNDQSV